MKRKPLKLRTKIAISFTALLVLWSLVVALSLNYLLSESSRDLIRERGVSIVRALATECAPLVHYEDLFSLSRLLKERMKAIPDLRYIAVLETGGRPVWSTFSNGIPKDLLRAVHQRPSNQDVSTQLIQSKQELIYDYEHEKGDVIVRMGLSLAPAQELTKETMTRMIWIAVAGFIAIFAIALYVSRPIEMLSQAVERTLRLNRKIEKGESHEGTLETSTITKHFHELMDSLEERTRQLDVSRRLAYLGEVSASMAHEINNPLGAIAMNTDFLEKRVKAGELSSDAAKEVERLGTATKRATFVAHKLLQFARYSTQDEKVKYRPVKIDALIQECLDFLEDRIRSSQMKIRREIPEKLPVIMCDEQGIQQVIFNLLTNALEASLKGGEITICVFVDEDWLTFQVSDRGKGMSEDILKQVTEPFFTTKKEGTGLGLAICNSIVRACRGSLSLESQPGHGTTVTVRLPKKEKVA